MTNALRLLAASFILLGSGAVQAQPVLMPAAQAIAPDGGLAGSDPAKSGSGNIKADLSINTGAKSNKPGLQRRCRLDKPLFGASPTSLKCYALAAYEPTPLKSLDESAMLGEPKMDHDDELLEDLDVPDGVRDAEDAVEVMRAWVADGALHVIFDPETFRHDVSEWGRLLGDVAQHIANAVELDGQMSRQEALNQIHEAIDVSVSANAVTMEGKIKGRTEH
ncbi:MAG: DUF5076 domain-containing protein [Pseudomonadota bacterium]